MKQTLKSFALLLLSGILLNCELDDVVFHATLDLTFHANEEGEDTDVIYNDGKILDLSTNSEIQPYLKKIKRIEITKVTYRITGYTEDPMADPPCTDVVITGGFMKFGEVGSIEEIVLGSFAAETSAVDLASITADTELDIDAEQFNALAELLLNEKQANVFSVGTLSCTPIKFDVVAKFYATVYANAIE
jgi:hypothetical protein